MPPPSADTPVELGVVVRYSRYDDVGPELRVALMRAFADPELADREAARLNSVRREHSEYFVKILRVKPSLLRDIEGLSEEHGAEAP